MSLHETFAVMGERLLSRYLMRTSHLDTQSQLAVSTASEFHLHTRLFNMAWAAKSERAIADAYWHSLGAGAELPQREDLKSLLAHMGRSPNAWKDPTMIAGEPFYEITYPLAAAGSLGVIRPWDNASSEEKRVIADRWLNIAAEGNTTNFTAAMTQMGIDYHSSFFISDAIDYFILQECQTLYLEKLMLKERNREKQGPNNKPFSFTLDLTNWDNNEHASYPSSVNSFTESPAQKARTLTTLNVKRPGGPLTREAREKLAAIVDDAPRAPKSLRSLMRTRDRSNDDSPSR